LPKDVSRSGDSSVMFLIRRDSDAAIEQKSRKLALTIVNSMVFIVFSIIVNDSIN
jgi:hypothetical protein